jgi:hypothetical protein
VGSSLSWEGFASGFFLLASSDASAGFCGFGFGFGFGFRTDAGASGESAFVRVVLVAGGEARDNAERSEKST